MACPSILRLERGLPTRINGNSSLKQLRQRLYLKNMPYFWL
ncbi:hypothetical protein HAL013_05470 [Helicobacter ailurogastricus]|uniref:Uncharacterized protein n=1 Tax=Helicobacter ailurogastricus TaxID=1578720 RepID=A0A0K2X574_9HELI|nr:hypothetical protein HAL013_05470 [Helicobacter ailurogastricus]